MIGTKRHISFRQYIKNKPTKWGVKVFVLCDSDTGYISNFEVYTGAQNLPDDKGATYHVVLRLMKDYLDQGYCVFMDNYYSSPILFNDLLVRGTDAVGTCVPRRKNFPKND